MDQERIDPVRPGEADDPEINAMLEAGVEMDGDASIAGIVARQPEFFKGFMAFAEAWWEKGDIERHIKALMRQKSAEIHQCTYCATVRLESVRDEVDEKKDAVFEEISADELTPRERLAVEFAEKMAVDPHRITDEFFEELREEFTEPEIVELILTECFYKMGHLIANTTKAGTREEAPYPGNLEYPLEDPDDVEVPNSDD